MTFNYNRIGFFLAFLISFVASAQTRIYENRDGKYKITIPEKWKERVDGTTTDIFAPDEGELDSWQEFVGVSLSEANGLSLEEAFAFYLEQDFPGYYQNFNVEKRGEEIINGQTMKWMLYSFTSSTTADGVPVTITLFNIFYLALHGDTLYSLNAIAEKDYYLKLEPDFLTIIRSFQINP